MKTNKKAVDVRERLADGFGAIADKTSPLNELKRSVLACFLWEDLAYENGENTAQRIKRLVPLVKAEKVAELAIQARNESKLRHVPLLIVREMARHNSHKHLVARTLEQIIQRADELSEFVSIYWADGKCHLSAQVKKGLAAAFHKFDEHQLAKYNQDNKIKLRDVLFLCHAKPADKKQESLWKRLINDEMKTPDTWEVALSAASDKRAEWTRLLKENKLGALALLRNLRNFEENKVDSNLVRKSLSECNPEKLLPFRFLTAAKYAPKYEAQLEDLMFKNIKSDETLRLPGKTIIVVDVSGSMNSALSSKSELNRLDSAIALTILLREICEIPVIYATAGSDYSYKHQTEIVPAKRGFSLGEKIKNYADKLGGGGIFTKQCLDYVFDEEKSADRIIVISDSQDCGYYDDKTKTKNFGKTNYLIDISCHKNGISYDKFHQISGFSENLVKYIVELERFESNN